MGRTNRDFIIVLGLFEILTSHAQPSLTQYLQLASLGPQGFPPPSGPPLGPVNYPSPPSYGTPNYPNSPSYGTPNYPSSPCYATSNYPSYQSPNYQNSPRPTASPSPSLPTSLAAISSLASVPIPNPSLTKTPTVPKASESIQPAGFDSNVLNNLAIALQLLIVSNILNMPINDNVPERLSRLELPKFDPLKMPKYESVAISPLALPYPVQSALQNPVPYLESPIPQLYSYESQSLPNSNFLGSSGFEPTMFGSAVSSARPNPRSSMALMSPYEALGPNSPFSDPILSTVYSPSYSKNDFQSPYASILAGDGHRDLFSMSDLF